VNSFGSALSQHPDPAVAVGETVGSVLEQVGPTPDLAVLVLSGAPPRVGQEVADAVHRLLAPRALVGAASSGVLVDDTEVERDWAVGLWAARSLPSQVVRLETIHDDAGSVVVGMPDGAAHDNATLLLFSDRSSFPIGALNQAAREQYPSLRIVGGVTNADQPQLFANADVFHDGAVGVLLGRSRVVGFGVAQGCRPLGSPFTVTTAKGNKVLELGFQPALARLRESLAGSGLDQDALPAGLHLGIVTQDTAGAPMASEIIMRAILGVDQLDGSLAVGARVEVGATVQFHVSDPVQATANLLAELAHHGGASALAFASASRGAKFFDEPHHDAATIHAALPSRALLGMFCSGEIAPGNGRNLVHGYSTSVLFLNEQSQPGKVDTVVDY